MSRGGKGDDIPDLPAISYVWQTPVRRARRQPFDWASPTGASVLPTAARRKLERIVSRAPEVMVKVTGRTKDVHHLRSHLAYITRGGELAAETETGALMEGTQGLRDLQEFWSEDTSLDVRRANGTLSVNLILSMPPGTDAVKVRDAVRAFAIDTFEGRHDYAFVLHEDDVHPHVHLTVRSAGYDGRRLNVRKADLQQWREQFAEALRLRGVEAEATPRRTRGQVRKADRGPVRAIKERGGQPRVERLARQEVARGVTSDTSERPWEARILDRQTRIRRRYLTLAEELARTDDPNDVALSQRVRAFVAAMPELQTRRQVLRAELARFSATRREQRERERRGANEAERDPDKGRAR